MEKFKVNKVLESVRKLLDSSEDYKNMEIIYILKDIKDDRDSIVVATEDDSIIEINPYTNEISNIPDWDYNFDEYVFKELESGKQIAYMVSNTHYGIWSTINDYYPEEIENKKGMQIYLKYCKENKITKEKLAEECKTNDVPNIIKYYKEKNKYKDR